MGEAFHQSRYVYRKLLLISGSKLVLWLPGLKQGQESVKGPTFMATFA